MSHPKTEAVRELIAAGLTNTAIGKQQGMERQTVGRIRRELGLPDVPRQPLTVEQKWRQRTRKVSGGHLEWTGERTAAGSKPVMRHSGKAYSATRVAYRIAHGKDPEGYAKPGCGMPNCVEPTHQLDTADHRPVHTPRIQYTSAEEKLAALTEPTKDGHVLWTGTVTSQGQQLLTFNGVSYTANRIAFRAHWKREPVGPVIRACEQPGCIRGEHLDDSQARRSHQAALRAVFGTAGRRITSAT
ncbi:hypothetical protein [Streptomyces sp. NRRL S-350]|uniref:hypothetical protein n=1 Tax=Streptomyces sp. NRRL S-350 TaxID=1463902 RepID=UPI000AF12DEB|nr:hypothetical protein [Streptomyces sp. NRRL S-350]